MFFFIRTSSFFRNVGYAIVGGIIVGIGVSALRTFQTCRAYLTSRLSHLQATKSVPLKKKCPTNLVSH